MDYRRARRTLWTAGVPIHAGFRFPTYAIHDRCETPPAEPQEIECGYPSQEMGRLFLLNLGHSHGRGFLPIVSVGDDDPVLRDELPELIIGVISCERDDLQFVLRRGIPKFRDLRHARDTRAALQSPEIQDADSKVALISLLDSASYFSALRYFEPGMSD